MATVVEIIAILERTVITKEALETTRLGKYVNELRRKTTNELLARRAKDLVRRWRVMIQENNTAGVSTVCSHIPSAVHQTNGTNLLLHQVSPGLRSNVSPALPQFGSTAGRCYSPSSAAAGDATTNFIPGYPRSPVKPFVTGDLFLNPSHHFKESSSISRSISSPKLHPLAPQVKLPNVSSNSDHLGYHCRPSILVNMDSVPRTHASNKRLRKEPSQDVSAKKFSRPNGQVVKGFDFMKSCVPSQSEIHGDGSRDSISGMSQGSSSCEVIPLHNKVPVMDMVFGMTCAAVTTATTTATTTTMATTVTSTAATDPFTWSSICSTSVVTDTTSTHSTSATNIFVGTTVVTTAVSSATDTITGCSTTPVPPAKTRRKRTTKLRRVSASASVTQAISVGDILKEKIASKVRTPKVKTTQELVASVQAKTGGASGTLPEDKLGNLNVLLSENKPSLAKCILMSRGTPTDALEISRNKTEHIAKFLQSQSELHPIQEDPSIVPLAEMEDLRLQKHLRGLPGSSGGDNYNSSPAEVSSFSKLSKDILQQFSSSKDSQSASGIVTNIHDQTVEDILPPVDVDAICWDESVTDGTDSEPPVAKEVTEEVIRKFHTEHIENVNGNVNEGASCDDSDNFREWHETVSKRSYQGEFLHILPYVVID
ncbi:mediator of RNA polymerase II transcription subunit 26 isoform X2 [Zootermopsis nevadensis]|nr:mediator of RNA polymerase II transcription subunit 26 isoform X2 [Zootermopsis nevadensis]XP_021939392.1 mediator of RNA polymerase II transcription subunit 26 isoform X2 [Zootermopsis nevadensis]XP_021939393.1 mediator of RNA polymerase II transcription subunit 26 isoform X2 [Zootermopsis nevadensis]XP_021939394.1 mediator of RNA polymerase II transcription subunit 26 isoform X2 [Zootermopsis nevadensis]